MQKHILKYTIRTNKLNNTIIEIYIRDYPTTQHEFTCFSVYWGHSTSSSLFYARNTRPATTGEIESIKETTLKTFKELYSDDYELQYLKRLPR